MSNRMKITIWILLVVGLIPTPVILLFWPNLMGHISENVIWVYGIMFVFPLTLCGACTIALMSDHFDNRPKSVDKSKSIAIWWVSSFILLAPINYYSLPVLGLFSFLTNWIQLIIFTVATVYFGLKIFRSKTILNEKIMK